MKWHLPWSISRFLSSYLAQRWLRDTPSKTSITSVGTPPPLNPLQLRDTAHLNLTRDHQVTDVVEGLLHALADGHEPMIPENKDLRGHHSSMMLGKKMATSTVFFFPL